MKFLYSDLNGFNPQTSPQLVDLQAIYQLLFNLFNTVPGERLFQPGFGMPLDDQLFEVIDDITSLEIYRLVNQQVSIYIPIIKINNNTTITPNPNDNSYFLDLYFDVIGLQRNTFNYQGSFVPST